MVYITSQTFPSLSLSLLRIRFLRSSTFLKYFGLGDINMPLGVLDDRKLEHVPGTSPLNELGIVALEDPTGIESSILKHDPTGRIVLVPQPSDSPNDPYNWPKWRKMMYTVAIGYGCGCVGGRYPSTHRDDDNVARRLVTPHSLPLNSLT